MPPVETSTTFPLNAGLTHMTHAIGIFLAAAASMAALIELASIETSTIPSYPCWTACCTNPACFAGVNCPSKIGDGVQPIAFAAACASLLPWRQLIPALPQEITATLPVPGSNDSVGCGNFTPLVFENFCTAACACFWPEFELELLELDELPPLDDVDVLLEL